MTDGFQDAPLREALPRDMTVPPDVTERMLAAIFAERDHQIGALDELAARRRRGSRGAWLVGAAATVALLMAIGVGIRGWLGDSPDPQALPSMDASAAQSDANADKAEGLGVAGSSSMPSGQRVPEAPQAKEDPKIASTVTLTADNILDQVGRLLSAESIQPQSQTDFSAQCAAIVGRSDAPDITKPVDFEGTSGLLVVWRQPDSYSIWVLALRCDDVNSVIYHSLLPSSSTE